MTSSAPIRDIFIVGGGINGTGIARDAVGRGYSVTLAEMNDLGSATSSASTKLFHGGLRYLEYFEISMVRKALIEREVLLNAMPHISWPMRFVLPIEQSMRFDSTTPTSRLLSFVFPWMKGRRPAWLIRFGLFLYDHLGGRKILPATARLELRSNPIGKSLKPSLNLAYEYSDCWVEDSRLVLLNAKDAKRRGAEIKLRCKVVSAEFRDETWVIDLRHADGATERVRARFLVNAAGPWVEDVIKGKLRLNSSDGVRLVRGSHIVTRRLFDHDRSYIFQGTDGRIVFAIPYENEFTLIGTTDADHNDPDEPAVCTPEERDYLIKFVNAYLRAPISDDDIVWTFSGVRPLFDDGAASASAATRDYVLRVDQSTGGSLLNVFGGKITTYRKLAEAAIELIDAEFDQKTRGWTADAPLPGGEFDFADRASVLDQLQADYPFIPPPVMDRFFRQYGTETRRMLEGCSTEKDLGHDFGSGVFEVELKWAIREEWVHEAEDFLWRRSKLGLQVTDAQALAIKHYLAQATDTDTS